MSRRNTNVFMNVIRELNLQNDETAIKAKAYELQKEVDRKINARLMSNWPSCKPVLCIHIALRIPFDKDSIAKLASTTEQNYYSSLSYIKKTLVISTLNFDLLASRFDCPKILPYLESMFEIFKINWSQKLTNANLRTIDWNNPVFKVAIFWCICKTFGGQSQISQQELIDLPEVTITRVELNKYTKLVETHCKSYIAELKSRKKLSGCRITFKKPIPLKKKKSKPKEDDKMNDSGKGKRGRKRTFQDDDIEEESNNKYSKVEETSKSFEKCNRQAVESEDEITCIGPMNSRGEMKIVNYWETQLYDDYLDWRESIIQKISERMDID
ncbi:17448_t:CDS:2 [Funneliformis geosporum]|uniref:17448_t:CDS:1 n=1 Tax=Funneliformis geosporum TaxID=1117311 RepID=A0A9W4SPJ8_9GLOM|nr:17448_t:CDS:2 [Funneliformis geosporum]